MKHFPFDSDRFEMTMNARAGVTQLIEVDEDYLRELSLKESVLQRDHEESVHCPPDCEALAWEALSLVLTNMATNDPEWFGCDRRGDRWTWTNRLLGSETTLVLGASQSVPSGPLAWLGSQVQEDLILMAEQPDGDTVCVAGHLCFPSAWRLPDKLGQSFLGVHAVVPGFVEQAGKPSDLMMRKLRENRPTARLNWSISPTDRLDLSLTRRHEWVAARREVTPDNAGVRCFLRVERQTFSRLPRTHGILFTIRTYLTPIAEIVNNLEQLRRMTSVLASLPPETRAYKGMDEYYGPLMAYLTDRTERPRYCSDS